MATDSIPVWLQQALALGSIAGTAIAAILAGSRSKSATEGQATVLAGTVTDQRSLRDIMDALDGLKGEMRDGREQAHSDSRAERDIMETLIRALDRNTEAQRMGSTPADMLATIARIKLGGKE